MKHNQKNQVESDSVPIPAHLCKFKSEYDSEYTRKRSQNTQHTHTGSIHGLLVPHEHKEKRVAQVNKRSACCQALHMQLLSSCVKLTTHGISLCQGRGRRRERKERE